MIIVWSFVILTVIPVLVAVGPFLYDLSKKTSLLAMTPLKWLQIIAIFAALFTAIGNVFKSLDQMETYKL